MPTQRDSTPNPPDQAVARTLAPTLADTRVSYEKGFLLEEHLAPDPFAQFSVWYEDAWASRESDEPHAMTLCTASTSGVPSGRTVLLKGVDERGFSWFTNYESRKGLELAANPHASLVFRWATRERQVVICGSVEQVDAAESDAYFASRPRGSQLGAIASRQSQVLDGRAALEARAAALEAEYATAEPARPAYWGGYRLSPISVEFWQGRPSRLHDRLHYRRVELTAPWIVERLSP